MSLVGCWSGLFPNHRSKRPGNGCSDQNIKPTPEPTGATVASTPCDISCTPQENNIPPPPPYPSLPHEDNSVVDEKFLCTIERSLDDLNPELRDLSLKIHRHPEMKWEEVYAHNTLSAFMESHGFKVTRHYFLETAWKAEFSYGKYHRVIGVNSEMDALPSGHACGHNLIAAAGVGIAIALKTVFETCKIPGKVILLGTPAEEGGGGKVLLLEKGGYNEMDACVMVHPAPGEPKHTDVGTSNAFQPIDVEYFGKSAHAATPWEGKNALDAAFVAYSAISALRQEMKPTHRVHGVISGKDWVSNVIPDYAKLTYGVRAPTRDEVADFAKRIEHCLQAGSLATSCEMKTSFGVPYHDLHQNPALQDAFASTMASRYGFTTLRTGTPASTDFGNISYALPSLHPAFSIPTVPNGGNHTPEFVKAAATPEAHAAMMTVIKGLSGIALKFILDDNFARQVQRSFDNTLPR